MSADHTATHNGTVATIREYLQWQKGWDLKVLGGLGQREGVPDVLCCLAGHFIAVEVKTGAGQLTERQRKECAAIEAAGGIVIVTDDVRDVERRLVQAGLVRPSLQ